MKKLKIFTCFILMFVLFCSMNVVRAEIVDYQQMNDYWRYFISANHNPGIYTGYRCVHYSGWPNWEGNPLAFMQTWTGVDGAGQWVYCVEPYVTVSDKNIFYPGYAGQVDISQAINNTVKYPFSLEQFNRAALIAWYGYGYGDHWDDSWYVATQMLVWKTVDPDLQIGIATSKAKASAGNFDLNFSGYENQILDLVNSHYVTPNFNITNPLVLNTPSTFNDSNNVLSKYEIIGMTNCTASKNGNQITITPTKVGDISVTLCKGNPNSRGPVLYAAAGVQDVLLRGEDHVISNVNAKAVGGSITIHKTDVENNQFKAQGDATLVGAVYVVRDSNGHEVARLTIGEDGTAKVKDLAPGTYTVQEITPPTGYNLNPEIYTARITTDNLYASLDVNQTVTEKVIKGNIRIQKRLQKTDYDPEIALVGAQFKATLKSDTSKVYYSNVSGEDGICEINNLPYGTYEVEECVVPDSALKVENYTVFISEEGKTYEKSGDNRIIDVSKKITIKVKKLDADKKAQHPNDYTQGDATFEGAEYTIWRDEDLTDKVTTIVVDKKDEDGYWYAKSGTMRTGTYYVKETKTPEGYNIDPKVYVYSKDNREQTVELVPLEDTSVEKVERGSVSIIKYDDDTSTSTENPALNAKLKLRLDSATEEIKDENTFYATINEYGFAEFIDEEWIVDHPDEKYTIPYGHYTITEVEGGEGGNTHFFMDPIKVYVDKQTSETYNIVGETEVDMFLRIHKTDSVSNEAVTIAGAKYKIWNCKDNDWVKLESQVGYLDEFTTNKDGFITLPQKLKPGKYIVYETKAPDGYYLDNKYRIPNDEDDLGNLEKGGVEVVIDKTATGLAVNSQTPKYDLYYDVNVANKPKTVKLKIDKKGEVLVGVKQTAEKVGEDVVSVVTPIYEERNIGGAKYEIYAKEDIKSPDKNYTYVSKGEVVDTVITSTEGPVLSKELYPGVYGIREIEVPKGFLKDTSLDDKEFELLAEGDDKVEVTIKSISLDDIRQKGHLTFEKEFKEPKYIVSEEKPKAVFGIYANEDINAYDGNVLIRKDTLLDLVTVEKGQVAQSDLDMPVGSYYYKELMVTNGYAKDMQIHNFTFENPDTTTEVVEIKGDKIINDVITKNLYLIKFSASSLIEAEKISLSDRDIDESMLEDRSIDYLNLLRTMTAEEIKEYLSDENNIQALGGAEYGIFADKQCTKTVKDAKTNEDLVIVTDNKGFYEVKELPVGIYYLKELKAPTYTVTAGSVQYEKSNKVITVELTPAEDEPGFYRALWDNIQDSRLLKKTDIFTGDDVPDCLFEIRDLEDNLIYRAITDKAGEAYIPLDALVQGKTYTYQEIDAPDTYKENGKLYELNTEKHEFTVDYELNEKNELVFKNKINVDNYRPTRQVLVRKTDDKTGEPLEGCKFSIVLLNENGEPYVNQKGETVYLVKDAVTNKDGEYLIEKAPKGRYKFIEVEAPEGYDLAEQEMEGYEFEINDESPELIIFEVTNTGDIAVIALVCVAVVSVLGIAYVILKNKKKKDM